MATLIMGVKGEIRMSKVHSLKPDIHTLHGFFSKELEPALFIQSGDTVVYQTLDAGWGLEKRAAPGAARTKYTERKPERQEKQFGHALLGPVHIQGAKPGLTLEIQINEVVPGCGDGPLPEVFRAIGTRSWAWPTPRK
jgi:acetamidase/formamidase